MCVLRIVYRVELGRKKKSGCHSSVGDRLYDGMDQKGSRGDSSKWMDVGYVLKVKLTRYSGRSDVGYHNKRVVMNEFRLFFSLFCFVFVSGRGAVLIIWGYLH